MRLPEPSAILFDLDGTLVDSLPTLALLMNDMLEELGRAPLPLQTLRCFVGDGPAKLVERALAETSGASLQECETAAADFLARYEARPTAGTVMYAGGAECLARLREAGIRLAVCTNKPEKVSRLLLEELGIAGHFEAVVGGDSCAERKPSPLPAQAACRILGEEPASVWFVGDNEHDITCGRAAGCAATILVAHGYSRVPLAELNADRIVGGLGEILFLAVTTKGERIAP